MVIVLFNILGGGGGNDCKVLLLQRNTEVFLRCVIPVVLSNNKNKLNGTYVYRHKHNYEG